MFKVIQVSTGYTDGSLEKKIIEGAGGQHRLINSEREEDIIDAAKDAEGLLVALTPVTRKIIVALPQLKMIVRAGIGVDNIDLDAARQRNVKVFNLPTYCQEEVADHTVALLLALERKIVCQVNDIKKGEWLPPSKYNPIYGMQNKTLGLIGFGGIAQKVMARVKPFGINVIVHDPYIDSIRTRELGATSVELNELFKLSDYISLHTPYTKETHHIINKQALGMMKPTAYIINTARGSLVDTNALYEAVKNSEIGGASLDVVERDIEGAKIFEKLNNVLITPHTAYYSDIANYNIKLQAGEVVAKFIRGEEQISIV